MLNFLTRVLVGNIVLYPSYILRFLIKASYELTYDPEKETVLLRASEGNGFLTLLEIRNISYESAQKLANGLGFHVNGDCLVWRKKVPSLLLHHDGGHEAEAMRMEMLRLGIPHRVRRNGELVGVKIDGHIKGLAAHTLDQLLELIRQFAQDNRVAFATDEPEEENP